MGFFDFYLMSLIPMMTLFTCPDVRLNHHFFYLLGKKRAEVFLVSVTTVGGTVLGG